MKPIRRPQKSLGFGRRMILTAAISLVILTILSGLVVSQDTSGFTEDTATFFQSRYILWDSTEKIIDPDFNITLIAFDNETHYYNIIIHNQIYIGNYTYYKLLNFTFNYSTMSELSIQIDNRSHIYATNIRVIGGVTAEKVLPHIEPFVIEFLPWELTQYEWDLFYSGVVAALIALPTVHFGVKYYRRRRGAVEV